MKIVIVGGGACGASCATRVRRLNENCEICILEKTNEISIANCGLPYYCSGIIENREDLLISSPQRFKDLFNIEVKLNTEVIDINRKKKYVLTKNGEHIYYNKLVLAQGANSIKPSFAGIDKKNIFTVKQLQDLDNIKKYISEHIIQNAVIIGGGFIGVEMAENLSILNINTTIVEISEQILTPVDYEIACFAQNEMRKNGVKLILSDGVKEFQKDEIMLESGKKIKYDIAILAIGVKSEIELAKKAGLSTNRGIIINNFMQTSDTDIYAGGDSIEVKNFITGENALIPLAGPANRQGRIIADNICGIPTEYKKTQGTFVVKVFNYTVACTGLNEKILKREHIQYSKILIFGNSHAGYYPHSSSNLYKLLFNNKGKILGAQSIGKNGVDKRIDIIATIMRNNGTVQELIDSELSYAPPYSSAKDSINILGMVSNNVLSGLLKPAFIEDIKNSYIIDVRPFKAKLLDGAISIPINTLRSKLGEIPKNKKILLVCETGYTSYVASRILMQNGFNKVYSLMAGMKLYREIELDKKEDNYEIIYNI